MKVFLQCLFAIYFDNITIGALTKYVVLDFFDEYPVMWT